MINIGYRAARWKGRINRAIYLAALPRIVETPLPQIQKVPFITYSFSCERDLCEQVLNIRSFIRNVGIPEKFVVISDGTYSDKSRNLLKKISSCVEVVDIKKIIKVSFPQYVYEYADSHAMGKKFAALMSIPIELPTIYTDSDIIFFPSADELITLGQSTNNQPRYLLDCIPSLDKRLLYNESEMFYPVNAGFMLLKQPINWEIALERLSHFQGNPNHHTEQTLVHLALHRNNALPLCHSKFILSVSDQFIYPDIYAGNNIALRHYVNNIRHKMWQSII